MKIRFLVILLIAMPGLVHAQGYGSSRDRTGSWEWSLSGIYQDSEKTGAQGGSSVDIDSAWGLGFNLGYNFNNRLAFGADFEWLRPDYKATLVSDSIPADTTIINHSFDQMNFRFKGVFNLIDGPLTPYAEAGVGWTYVDSNVMDGPPVTGCWWHPWWGYICSNYYSTYTETSFSYGGALGVRYALKNGTILKLSYSNYSLDSSGAAADPTLSAFRLEYGWRF